MLALEFEVARFKNNYKFLGFPLFSVFFIDFLKKIDFGSPPRSASIFVPLLWFLHEIDVSRVLAISDQKSIVVDSCNEKSMFRKNDKFQKKTSLEPVQPRATFRPHLDGQNVAKKWSATAQARMKSLPEICHFFKIAIFPYTCQQKIDFRHKIAGTRKKHFSSQSLRSGPKNEAHQRGARNRFLQ